MKTSNLSTNEETTDETEFFKFESEFATALELFTITYEDNENVINAIVSFNPPTNTSEHIIEKGDEGKVVTTTGGVLLGKMSFKMTADEFDISGFSLVEDTNSPTTGIKINLNIIEAFENQSTFRFTDQTLSKDATLSNIVVSSGEIDEEDATNSTYKEYPLTPEFNKETLDYEIKLLEYIDTMRIKVVKTDENATMKIKVPKRDEDNKLVYDSDGTTIIYEEKDLDSGQPFEFVLNKLGEPDTQITVVVTAEDTDITKSYQIVIKRPYGILKGQIYTSPTENTTGTFKSDIRIYKSEEVKTLIDWETIQNGVEDDIHDKLLTLNSLNYTTNDDGTYQIYIVPGTYDILLDKPGYLDHIYKTRIIQAEEVIDLGYKELIAGDVNKDGSIQILDLSELMSIFGIDNVNPNYNVKYDFNEDGEVQILDLSFLMSDFSETRKVE